MLGYIEDVDDKLFKKYSHGQDFNSFINEFDHTTIKKIKKKNRIKRNRWYCLSLH